MCASDRGGVHVARIHRDLTTRGDRLGSRPVERMAEHAVWINDSTPEDTAPATLIVRTLGNCVVQPEQPLISGGKQNGILSDSRDSRRSPRGRRPGCRSSASGQKAARVAGGGSWKSSASRGTPCRPDGGDANLTQFLGVRRIGDVQDEDAVVGVIEVGIRVRQFHPPRVRVSEIVPPIELDPR